MALYGSIDTMITFLCREGFVAIEILLNEMIHCYSLIALCVPCEIVLAALFESKCGHASEIFPMKEREDILHPQLTENPT